MSRNGDEGGGEDEAEKVMSEVHLGCPPRFPGIHVSCFTVAAYPPPPPLHEIVQSNNFSLDEDGDLVLIRRRTYERGQKYRLKIQHNVTSSLRDVGMQVWKAALLLTDFVLHTVTTGREFNGVTALELGAGTGIVGIAIAQVAQRVFITDKGTKVLENCEANAYMNSSLCKIHHDVIRIRELDWQEKWPPPELNESHTNTSEKFAWSSRDIKEAENATVLLAADVIYSDNLTDAFFGTLQKLMSHGTEKVLYLALEKRYNFSLDELDVVANGYAHFRSFIDDYGNEERTNPRGASARPKFRGRVVDLADIPQYIREYVRGNDLEMWWITNY